MKPCSYIEWRNIDLISQLQEMTDYNFDEVIRNFRFQQLSFIWGLTTRCLPSRWCLGQSCISVLPAALYMAHF